VLAKVTENGQVTVCFIRGDQLAVAGHRRAGRSDRQAPTHPSQLGLLRDATASAPGGSSVARYRLDLDRSRDVDLRRGLSATADIQSWPSTCGRMRMSATASVKALGTLVAISPAGLTSPPSRLAASGFTVTST